jgi:glutamate-ammonia-ligase adenylyltransferase
MFWSWFLLDELIDPSLGRILPSREEICATTKRVLRSHQGPEDTLQALNHIKLATSLRVAVAELETKLSAREAQEALTALAEALLDACLALAAIDIQARYPGLTPGGLCVVGYGSLGARELAFGSDLDLIFLYEASKGAPGEAATQPLERFYTQLVRRLLSLLTLPTPSGKLYETDTRLRPNGRSGLLVSSVSAFEKYQHEQAWIWELQALTRARALGGNPEAAAGFARIRRSVLSRPQPPAQLREQILAMRTRLRSEFRDRDPLKHAPGGLVDIDFIAQLGVLECAARHPEVLDATGTPGQLRALAAAGWLSQAQAEALLEAHETFARARHLSTIARHEEGDAPDLLASRRHCEAILGTEAEAWFSSGSREPGSILGAPGRDHSG